MALTARRIKIIKTFNLYCSFFIMGMCNAVIGPTLIDLENIVNTDIQSITFIFTARAIGFLCGSLTGGVVFDLMPWTQLILGIFSCLTSVTMFSIPWSRTIKTLIIWMVVNGVSLGIFNTGGNVCCLNLWGKDCGPFFQALHFTFGIGALIAPLVAAPFLGDYKSYDKPDNNSAIFVNFTDTPIGGFLNNSFSTSSSIPTVTYGYAIIGSFAAFVTIFFFIAGIISPTDEKAHNPHATGNNVKSFAFTSSLVFISCFLTLSSLGIEIGYAQMLTTYATKGPLKLTTKVGSYMTSVYWGAYTVSRLCAIFIAAKFSSLTMIVFDVFVASLGALTLMFLAVSNEWALWLSSILLGTGIASFFPSTISWVEKHITVTSKIASLFAVICGLGEMVIPYTISHFIDKKPEVFIYIVALSCLFATLGTLAMYLRLRNSRDKYTAKAVIAYTACNSDNVRNFGIQ